MGKNYIKDKIDEHKLRTALIDYIGRQRKYNEIAVLAEEIDFEGLVEYIHKDLLSDVETRIFSLDRKKRGEARQRIVQMACEHVQATTEEARYQVSKCISSCLDIIRNFYSKGIHKKDYILADEVVDAVAGISDVNTQKTLEAIEKSEQAVLNTLTTGYLFSYDKAVRMAQVGDVGNIGDGIRQLLGHITLEHPLYPLYGYDYKRGGLVSVPLKEEAKVRYPVHYKFTGALKIGDQYYNDPYVDPADYAYRHQLSITMEVSKAVRYLGEMVDPTQTGMEEITLLQANPPEFPPAFACAIKVGVQTFFEYVLLRMQEILDDGTFVINNNEQDGPLHFEVRINPSNPSRPNFRISMQDARNSEYLKYMMFMKTLKEVKDLHIYVLEAKEDIIAGVINEVDLKTGFSSVEEEIDFLERLCDIEEYFDVTLTPDRSVSSEEYQVVQHISELIRRDEVIGRWEDATFTCTMNSHFREEILSMDNAPHLFSYVGVYHAELFGASIDFRFMRTFKCAYLADLEKLKKKAEILDDGDSIKFTFKPGEDKTAIETLHIPEQMEKN